MCVLHHIASSTQQMLSPDRVSSPLQEKLSKIREGGDKEADAAEEEEEEDEE